MENARDIAARQDSTEAEVAETMGVVILKVGVLGVGA
jgi:hypothetical protein